MDSLSTSQSRWNPLRGRYVLCLLLPAVFLGCGAEEGSGSNSPTLPSLSNVTPPPPPIEYPESWGAGFIERTPVVDEPFTLEDPNPASMDEFSPSSGLIADLDDDGQMEVIQSSEGCCTPGELHRIHSWDAETSSWTRRPDLEETIYPDQAATVGVLDVDGDGLVDILQSNPSGVLRRGLGNGEFTERTLDLRDYTNETAGLVQAVDLDRDGLLDLVVGNHQCEGEYPSVIPVLQEGRGRWRIAPGWIPASVLKGTIYAVMDFPLPGYPTTLFMAGRNCDPSDPFDPFVVESARSTAGAIVWKGIDPTPLDSHYKDTPEVSFGPMSNANPMGMSTADFNGDGLVDLLVTLDILHLILRGEPDGTFTDISMSTGIRKQTPLKVGWGISASDFDLDGRDDVVLVNGPPDNGPEEVPGDISVFWNSEDFLFGRVASGLGITARGPWRGLHVEDLDGDGDPDFVVSGVGHLPQVLENQVPDPGRGLVVRLKGTLSTPHGNGAYMVLRAAGSPPQPKYAGHIGSPNVQSVPASFFAWDPTWDEATLEIRWPSGLTSQETLTGPGHVLLEEPSSVRIEPSSRVVEAGSGESVTFILTRPADVETMEVRALLPQGTLKLEIIWDGDEGSVSFPAPGIPGYTTFEIQLDGEPLRILPKVFWISPSENEETP